MGENRKLKKEEDINNKKKGEDEKKNDRKKKRLNRERKKTRGMEGGVIDGVGVSSRLLALKKYKYSINAM